MEHNGLTKVTTVNHLLPNLPEKNTLGQFVQKLCNLAFYEVEGINISPFFKKISFKDKWVIVSNLG